MRAICPAYLALLNLFTLTTLGKEQNVLRSSSRNFSGPFLPHVSSSELCFENYNLFGL